MSYVVEFTEEADDDVTRLYAFLPERAETLEDLDLADKAVKGIRDACVHHLAIMPYSYRKVGSSSTLRELIIPFASTGYVVRFDIRSPELVLVIGARHQRGRTSIENARTPVRRGSSDSRIPRSTESRRPGIDERRSSPWKSAMLRITTVIPRTIAVAAIMASRSARNRCLLRLASKAG